MPDQIELASITSTSLIISFVNCLTSIAIQTPGMHSWGGYIDESAITTETTHIYSNVPSAIRPPKTDYFARRYASVIAVGSNGCAEPVSFSLKD